ncbi:hypothetical protein [Nocardia sp. NPDC050710]|uniref:hypothetical protein n=1 Tax=Nocardia sp. NPDC050710 TaxID=3157220 RepID=UPI0033C370B5
MKLRSLLHRRHADRLPLLPSPDPDEFGSGGGASPRRVRTQVQEERLERLLTPSELEMVEQHRL